jgi:magnesium chelatase family protein
MFSIRSFALRGVEALPLRVEVEVGRGLPSFTMIGLPDSAVRVSRERVRAALINSGLEFPSSRILVSFSPSTLRQAGPAADLAIAAAILGASGQLNPEGIAKVALAGELALDGSLRPICGALAFAEAARADGLDAVALPAANAAEAALAEGIETLALESVGQLPALAAGDWRPPRLEPLSLRTSATHSGGPDMADLRGQPELRYALEVVAAAGHPLLMLGPAGAGKSMAAARLPGILPDLSPAEAIEVVRIAGACGRIGDGQAIGRPFRAPHHTISAAGLIGGGLPARPGEVTLAHRGVLYLDQVIEFGREAIEALRPAIQAAELTIQRGGVGLRLPCSFLLLAASEECPCGRGPTDPACVCPPAAVERFAGRLRAAPGSEGVVCRVAPPSVADLAGAPGESSAEIRVRVAAARAVQAERLGEGRCNADMNAAEVRECGLDHKAALLLSRQETGGPMDAAVRIARTLADLEGAELVEGGHLARALGLRGTR